MANKKVITGKAKLFALLLLLTGAVGAYAQQWHTTVEISYPAELTLPDDVYDLLLVNNTVAHPDLPDGAFYTLMAASEMLEGSDYLPSVLETSQNTSASLYRKQLFSREKADSLMTLYQSDALLVLNQEFVHSSVNSFATEAGTYYAYLEVIAASHWTLFFRSGSQDGLGSRTLQYVDTLYWENEAEETSIAKEALPTTEEANSEMCVYVGERMAERLLPRTETEDRYLYDLGDDDPGMQYFTRKQWQQAIDAWAQPISDNKKAAYAAANSAVAYELLGDINAAAAAAEKAINLFSSIRSAEARQQSANLRYYLDHLRQ